MTDENNVRFIRLKTGDDLVSEVLEFSENNDNQYILINPLKVVYVPTDTGHMQVAFMPWVFTRICDFQEYNINANDVMIMNIVSDYMSEYYWKSVDSFFSDKEELVEEPESTKSIDEESLEEILQELNSRRTFH